MSARVALPDSATLTEAAERLRSGELVAFPTETVYGLGTNALDAAAVAKIYTAKGRPATNPIIVHVASVEQAKALVKTWPAIADELAAAHWPGPLTLVLEKAEHIPDIVTAGGPTVGIRIPNHPVALELLRLAGVPVAAPSANRSEEVSPTLARHVADSLGAFVDDLLILDGGPCEVGIESTVLDVTCDPPRVLRPGMVTVGVHPPARPSPSPSASEGETARSPGQMLRHYAPKAQVVLVPPEKLLTWEYQPGDGLLWYNVWPGDAIARYTDPAAFPQRCMSRFAKLYAAQLYEALREMDARGVKRLLIALPPKRPSWAAIHDRLRRAASPSSH